MNKSVDLGKTPIKKLFLILSLPAILSQLVNALYNIIDRVYIGHIPNNGAMALTGVGICFPIIMVISAFSALIAMGAAPRASIYMGKKDNKSAEKILGNSFTMLFITAMVLTFVTLVFKEQILYLFGASEQTIGFARRYISIYALGTVFVQMTLGMNAFISAQGFSKVSMKIVIIGAVLNIALDPIFIFGLNLGVVGAAVATIVSQAISSYLAVRFLRGNKTVLKLRVKNLKVDFKLFLPCIALGIAPFVMISTESVLVLCFNTSLLKYGGDLAVGAMTILSGIMQFAMLPLSGFAQGGQPIISYNYGAKNIERIEAAFKLQTIACFIYSTIIWALGVFTPKLLVSIFTSDPNLISISSWALKIYMSGILLMGLQISCQQTFIALGNSKVSTFLACFRKLIMLIPLIYILPVFLEDKVFAVLLAEPISDIAAVSLTCIMFFFEFKRLKRTMRNKAVN